MIQVKASVWIHIAMCHSPTFGTLALKICLCHSPVCLRIRPIPGKQCKDSSLVAVSFQLRQKVPSGAAPESGGPCSWRQDWTWHPCFSAATGEAAKRPSITIWISYASPTYLLKPHHHQCSNAT